MKRTVLFAASVAALALAGCKKEADTPATDAVSATPAANDITTGTVPPAATPAVSPGQAFANTAAASDMFEIETSKLAVEKAQSAKVKTFAQAMIKAHTDSTAKLKAAATSASPAITPAPALSAMQQQVMTDLQGKTGAAFDQAYIKAQTDGHQATLDALKAYSATGDVPSLKTFATEMVPIVTAHLNMAKGL